MTNEELLAVTERTVAAAREDLEALKRYREFIYTHGVCIKQQPGPFYQHPQDEYAKELLLRGYDLMIQQKEVALAEEFELLKRLQDKLQT